MACRSAPSAAAAPTSGEPVILDEQGGFDGGTGRVVLAANCATVDVTTRAGSGWDVTVTGTENARPTVEQTGDGVSVRSPKAPVVFPFSNQRSTWQVELGTDPYARPGARPQRRRRHGRPRHGHDRPARVRRQRGRKHPPGPLAGHGRASHRRCQRRRRGDPAAGDGRPHRHGRGQRGLGRPVRSLRRRAPPPRGGQHHREQQLRRRRVSPGAATPGRPRATPPPRRRSSFARPAARSASP